MKCEGECLPAAGAAFALKVRDRVDDKEKWEL